MALVSQSDARQIQIKHFADCLFAGQWAGGFPRILDLGSGAGFPGIILSILHREATVTMVDSNRKKISFLTEVIARMRITNARAIEARMESLQTIASHAGAYDLVTTRALTSVEHFLPTASSFVAPHGRAMMMKGPNYTEEIRTRYDSGFREPSIESYRLPDGSKRFLLLFERQ